MAELLLGLVDSGLGPAAAGRVRAGCSFGLRDGAVEGAPAQADLLGHGSALAEILLQVSPRVSLLNAQVFGARLSCSAAEAAAALVWVVERGARLVNLSFGLREDRAVLRAACDEAQRRGVILVASSPARGDPVYPAAYPGVIRATGDARCSPAEISFLDTPQADFGAHVRCAAGSVAGASVGCARICARLASLLLERPELRGGEARAQLAEQARYRGPERRRV